MRNINTTIKDLRGLYVQCAGEAADALEAIIKVLAENGCDCSCDHHHEDHTDECERCLACRVNDALRGGR